MAAAADRLGRNVVDCLNTGYKMRDEGKLLVTYGHDGPWDLDDQVDETRLIMEAWGAQMELRAIPVRADRDGTARSITSSCIRTPRLSSVQSPIACWLIPKTSHPAVRRPA